MSADIQAEPQKEGEGEDVDPFAPLPEMIDKILEYDEAALEDERLDHDQIFVKLKGNLKKFTIEADKAIKEGTMHEIPDYDFQIILHHSLRNVLWEIVLAGDKKRQDEYLLRVYKWYFKKLAGCGAMDEDAKEEEERFINP